MVLPYISAYSRFLCSLCFCIGGCSFSEGSRGYFSAMFLFHAFFLMLYCSGDTVVWCALAVLGVVVGEVPLSVMRVSYACLWGFGLW